MTPALCRLFLLCFVLLAASCQFENDLVPTTGDRPTQDGEGILGFFVNPEQIQADYSANGVFTFQVPQGGISSETDYPENVTATIAQIHTEALRRAVLDPAGPFLQDENTEPTDTPYPVSAEILTRAAVGRDGNLDEEVRVDPSAGPVVVILEYSQPRSVRLRYRRRPLFIVYFRTRTGKTISHLEIGARIREWIADRLESDGTLCTGVRCLRKR